MSTLFPGAIDNGTSLPDPSATNDTNSPSLSSGQTNQNDALIAIETLIGTNSSQTTPAAQYNVLQATGTSSSEWGLLTSNNVSSSTGTGSFVFATSPTIDTPTLSSPIIDTPTFSGSLGSITTSTITASGLITANGGITASGSFTATGLVTYTDLVSTIFSGQVSTVSNSGTAGGTWSYVNLGGIKLAWIISSNVSMSTSPSGYTFVMPSGFFSGETFATSSAINMSGFANAYTSISGLSTTTMTVYLTGGGTGTSGITLVVIGS